MSTEGFRRFTDTPRERLVALHERHDGNVTRVAEELGCSWTWARELLVRHGLHEPDRRICTVLEELDPDDLPAESGGGLS